MRWTVSIAVVLAAAGCAAEEDAELAYPSYPATEIADDRQTPLSCDRDFGRVYVLDDIQLLPPDQGIDIDGDGVPDNGLGALHEVANPAVRDSLDAGYANLLVELAPWMDDPTAAPTDLSIALYHGIDTDQEPANNFDGSGRFVVAKEQFDVSCRPTSSFGSIDYDAGSFRAATNSRTMFLVFFGGIEFSRVHLDGTIADDMGSISGMAAGVWTLCSMSTAPFPGSYPGTWLDLLANDSILLPDIDMDGDGIEQVIGNGDTVVSCIDGDGTEVPGPFCACDPRIADGYSVSAYAHGVPATVIDIVESTP